MNYVVILNWRNIEDTQHCLNSLLMVNNPDLNIIICDNDSGDDSLGQIEQKLALPEVRVMLAGRDIVRLNEDAIINAAVLTQGPALYLLQNKENYGYAGGNNRGIRLALLDDRCDYIWLLNNDTEVTSESYLPLLRKMQSDKTIGVCGSVLLLEDDRERLQGVGGKFNQKLCISSHVLDGETLQNFRKRDCRDLKIDYVIGASMLISADVLKTVGLLSEEYFLYYEEIDFCLRVKKHGKISFAEDSFVFHKLGSTIKKSKGVLADYLSIKNRLIVAKKFYPKYYPIVWLSLVGVLFNRFKRAEFVKAKNVVKVMTWDAITILFKHKTV